MLGFQQSTITSTGYSSRRFSSNVSYQQRLGTTGDLSFRSTYSSSDFSTSDAADQELETDFTWRQQLRAFTMNFAAQKRYDLDASRYTGDDSCYSLSRTPDIVLDSDSARLGDRRLLGSGFEVKGYLGHFEQRPDYLSILPDGAGPAAAGAYARTRRPLDDQDLGALPADVLRGRLGAVARGA